MIFIVLLLTGLIVLIPGNENSAYQECCRMECWDERKPCCLSF